VGVVLVVAGEALLSGMVVLFGYAAFMAIGYHLFVTHYEEPTLEQLFGEPYARYREAAPRWLPRRPGRTRKRVIAGLAIARPVVSVARPKTGAAPTRPRDVVSVFPSS
jgi:hypothetical protein